MFDIPFTSLWLQEDDQESILSGFSLGLTTKGLPSMNRIQKLITQEQDTEMITITSLKGYTLTASPNHKILALNKDYQIDWVSLEDLEKDRIIGIYSQEDKSMTLGTKAENLEPIKPDSISYCMYSVNVLMNLERIRTREEDEGFPSIVTYIEQMSHVERLYFLVSIVVNKTRNTKDNKGLRIPCRTTEHVDFLRMMFLSIGILTDTHRGDLYIKGPSVTKLRDIPKHLPHMEEFLKRLDSIEESKRGAEFLMGGDFGESLYFDTIDSVTKTTISTGYRLQVAKFSTVTNGFVSKFIR